MSHRLTSGSSLAACALAVAIASNCREPVGVVPNVIMYDVTTTLDSFSFETGAPSPPECPNSTLYCTHRRAFTGAELFGTLILTDSVSNLDWQVPTGTFGGKFCDSIDRAGLTGCLHVSAIPVAFYKGGLWRRMGPNTTGSFGEVGGSGLTPAIYFLGTSSGESLYGRVWWVQMENRSPPTHYGRFVARRRK
jgi:hypothetical protein